MKTVNNIAIAVTMIIALALVCASPFGDYTAMQFACNAVTIFLVMPALIVAIILNNPELTKSNSLFK